ncbi:MAG: Gx transporter family protein [Oscillospiraceae bacterium]|nr:Gx transporter family protein [Oscillospiraceae bacterium]
MDWKLKKMAAGAMLTAAALIVFIIEAQIPPIVPIPGIKLGLSNVVTLAAILMLGKSWGSAVHILRIVLGTLFTGQAVSFLYSITGGVCCLIAMLLLTSLLSNRWLWLISAISAVIHAGAQLVTAAIVMQTKSVLVYAPIILFSAIVTGVFTGLCVQLLLQKQPKLQDLFQKK